ncbi:Transport protein particle (TRAPP) component Trs23A [Monocercomonoides exilis]|uniref:Transport protein particle (TRAPP) component Trs23A n=2 Tax=Monocercomonoides exilis TaxID=2049356 RepID=UPI003559EB3C|nr:Transport protein particle (TRAPP) component Trs23A [Monocercomonoides exilis]|eukprot:MONOS_16843.1-p1 / transcript=MONOS_16843.1 / gene=MONOS_16843 / organism=Monocercomonoides_exilis_PA203 / gene_product=Transport protein particle (TRAPP) component Trs23A / transcript_product=Transport protein particle (TRAPP) component Trs23A / location=Mono_scaffold00036:168143-168703(+) / protein_length=158 / sequence_SO=supercontig / SO=protein_coding / is_pseudo=false
MKILPILKSKEFHFYYFGAVMSKTGLLSLWIISPSGGLIYKKDLAPDCKLANEDSALQLAGFFHSQYAISAELSPIPHASSGIESIETDNFTIQCLKSPTGIKFLAITELGTPNVQKMLARVYVLFSDYVCKNPFYAFNQPIKNALFDSKIMKEFSS